MKHLSRLLAAVVVLFGASTFSHAASVGQLICTAEGNQLQVNVVYFTFGVTQAPVGSTVTGPVYQMLDVHAALSQFGPFLQSANKKISKCSLFATMSDGTQADIVFSGITLNSVTAVARTPLNANDPPAMYTEATFQYTDIKVKSSGGTDDGGTDGGWYNPKKTTGGGGGSL